MFRNLFSKYNLYAHQRLGIPNKTKMDAISAWQAVFFKKILLLLLPFSVLLYVPGLIMSLLEDLYMLAFFDTLALLVLLIAFFSKNLELKTRKIIVLADFYLMGIILLVILEWSGPGLIYLLSVSVMATLIINQRAGFISLATNVLVFILFVLFENKIPYFSSSLNAGGIFAVGLNYVLFNALLVLAVSSLTEALGEVLGAEKETKKQLEVEVAEHKKAREKAVESDKLKSMFLANVSHEIRTPMNGILGFTDLLKNPQLTGEQQDTFISIIQKSGERMLSTISDLIDISMIESGQAELHVRSSDIGKMTEELKVFYQNEATKKNLQFKGKCLLKKPYLFETDEQKLYSVVSNLLKNAVKFTEKGSVELICSGDEQKLVVTVTDTGSGIPENKRDVIFDRFTQVHVYEKREFEGSGLGLSIAKAYTEMLGGSISFESELGKGTTFVVEIPAGRKTMDNVA